MVLKDVFDLSLDEIAEALSTTTGAIKAALHRGRDELVEPTPSEARVPAPSEVCGELGVPWRSNGYTWFLRCG